MYFNTLITPYKIVNIRLIFNNLTSETKKNKFNKLFIKQSYLLLTWFWYIKKKHNINNLVQPSFVYKPTKKYRITFLKTPMAHKTFSQEQVKLQYFLLQITFKILLPVTYFKDNLLDINKMLYLILHLRQNIPFVETNLFLLKRFKISFSCIDNQLFYIK
jgi:hypothetical protein